MSTTKQAARPSAIEMAQQALEDERRPQREAAEAAAAAQAVEMAATQRREAESAKRRARARVKASPLGEWFPGVRWVLVDQDPAGMVVAPAGEEEGQLRLMLCDSGEVRFVTRARISDHGYGYPQALTEGRHYSNNDYRWWGGLVTSAASVGRSMELRREYEARLFEASCRYAD